jgi:hypothetical protein
MPAQLSQLLARAYPALKGLSLEIEIGCWWCGWTEHYLEDELLIVFNFLDSSRSYWDVVLFFTQFFLNYNCCISSLSQPKLDLFFSAASTEDSPSYT